MCLDASIVACTPYSVGPDAEKPCNFKLIASLTLRRIQEQPAETQRRSSTSETQPNLHSIKHVVLVPYMYTSAGHGPQVSTARFEKPPVDVSQGIF